MLRPPWRVGVQKMQELFFAYFEIGFSYLENFDCHGGQEQLSVF